MHNNTIIYYTRGVLFQTILLIHDSSHTWTVSYNILKHIEITPGTPSVFWRCSERPRSDAFTALT